MKNYPKYQQYKPTNIPWLGEIPEHWGVLPGMAILKENRRRNKGMVEERVLSLSYGNIVIKPKEKLVGLVPESFETYQIVEQGDIIIRCTDLQNDQTSLRTGLSNFRGIITSAYLNLQVLHNHNQEFIHYYLHALDITKVLYKFGSGLRQNLSFLDFRRLPIPLPPLPEQHAIAAFLDDKCGKIDRAIKQKKKLIALLKERKQIIIQQAVTKGLNPNAEMKDSGVEWIGEIPEGWEVKRLKYVVEIIKRIAGHEGPDVLSITQKGIKIKDITSGEGQIAMDYSKYQLIYKGEFAMNHMDLLTGYVDISNLDGVISPDYRVFKPIYSSIIDEYLLKIFQIGYKSRIFYKYGQGVSQLGRWRFPAHNFRNFLVPIPPLPEQKAIVAHIEAQSAKIDRAVGLQERQIEKLKKYREVLIDGAVRGRIKVGSD